MSLKDLGEFGLIDRISAGFKVPEGIVGIGDDCSVLPQKEGHDTLVSADMLVDGTHFLLSDVTPRDLGWKSAAVNFSDIAACGGRATGSFLSIALPQNLSEEWMDEFIAGFREMSLEAGAPLLGGDTTSADRLCINVTVLGEVPSGRAKLRSAAKPGDLVCVTGPLGDSAAGLKLILEGLPRVGELIRRHYRPVPRLREGQALAALEEVHAMMDISDGIASDLGHILEASGKAAVIELENIPLSRELKTYCTQQGLDPLGLATGGGEDYELLFTLCPDADPGIAYTVIGRITDGRGIEWKGSDRSYQGFRHF